MPLFSSKTKQSEDISKSTYLNNNYGRGATKDSLIVPTSTLLFPQPPPLFPPPTFPFNIDMFVNLLRMLLPVMKVWVEFWLYMASLIEIDPRYRRVAMSVTA